MFYSLKCQPQNYSFNVLKSYSFILIWDNMSLVTKSRFIFEVTLPKPVVAGKTQNLVYRLIFCSFNHVICINQSINLSFCKVWVLYFKYFPSYSRKTLIFSFFIFKKCHTIFEQHHTRCCKMTVFFGALFDLLAFK